MLDSSPLSSPPPKKLKRTASVASLPSPPPSVDHLNKKRSTSQRFTDNRSDTESEDDSEAKEATKGGPVLGRKLLFPAGPSASSVENDLDNPFIENAKPSNARDQLALDATCSPSVRRAQGPASPPPSRRRIAKSSTVPPRTPPPVGQRGGCFASEIPVFDEENNPFLSDSPPKLRRPRAPAGLAEQPTMTYVFKGVKTSFPNPNYNLPESAYERSRLPLSDPDYSPPPTCTPTRLFPEAYATSDDVEDEDEDSTGELGGADDHLPTPDKKLRMSKLFVDGAGNALPDSGPQGIRGKTMDPGDIGRMAVGPIRGRG